MIKFPNVFGSVRICCSAMVKYDMRRVCTATGKILVYYIYEKITIFIVCRCDSFNGRA